ncbi:MAG TPA: tRNA modification GTPase, partial [Acidobacteriaceae bacterium]
AGARLAAPGEFTQRAFLNGRLDLTQAEAVHDLIAAQTLEQARMAAQQLGGALSRRITPIKDQLVTLITLLEAGMDFAAGELDDVDVVSPAQIRATLARIQPPLEDLARSYAAGHRLREGASLALVGRPNVGKSSLFNRLLDRERAIVTPLPGTTRDTVEEITALGGIPLRLIDTAGLRLSGDQPADEAEALGIARSREALADADLVLLILDATTSTNSVAEISRDESALLNSLESRPHLVVLNKVDLLEPSAHPTSNTVISTEAKDRGLTPNTAISTEANDRNHPQNTVISTEGAQRRSGETGVPGQLAGWGAETPVFPNSLTPDSATPPTLRTSALTGEGLATLRSAILRLLQAGNDAAATGILNSLRQHEAVAAALDALAAAATANDTGIPHEFLLSDLHRALRALDTLTGATTTDDILNRIFSTFCIGK